MTSSIAFVNQHLLEHPSLFPVLTDLDPRLPNLVYNHNEFEGGRTLWDVHLNQAGKGIPKYGSGNEKMTAKQKFKILDVVEGRVSHHHFKPDFIKTKMIEEGILKEECVICEFHERRVNDYKVPLILNFKDNNPNHYNLGNIRFLCYNCFFLNVGDIFNKQDIKNYDLFISATAGEKEENVLAEVAGIVKEEEENVSAEVADIVKEE